MDWSDFLFQPHRLHAKYVAGVLIEAVEHLKRLPNLNQCSTAVSKQVTICGDLHGKLDDLLVVFHKVRSGKTNCVGRGAKKKEGGRLTRQNAFFLHHHS